MADMQKKITLDPNYLSLSGNKKHAKNIQKTKKKQKFALSNNSKYNSKTLRKKFIEKIKTYQNKCEDEAIALPVKTTAFDEDNDFKDSMNFLQGLSEKKKKKKMKKENETINKKEKLAEKNKDRNKPNNEDKCAQNNATVDVAKNINNNLDSVSNVNNSNTNESKSSHPIHIHTSPNRMTIKNQQPEYSCLKGGSRPTFREWKNMTQRKDTITPSQSKVKITIPNDNPLHNNHIHNERINNLNKIKHEYKQTIPSKPQSKKKCVAHRKIRTVKYKLGKTSKGVGVLVKNTDTRRKVKHEISLLRKKAITEVKQYLRDKNLLKAGSDAPPDVLRQMYEQAILSGELTNKSDDNLFHNFMNK